MFWLLDGIGRAFAAIAIGLLLIVALPVLAVIGYVSSRHSDAVYNENIPNAYVGQWVGDVKPEIPVEDDDLYYPIRGHIMVEIPKGLSQSNLLEVAAFYGPLPACRAQWTISDITSDSVTFDSSSVAGREKSCGTVDAIVVMKPKGRNQMSLTWEDIENCAIATATVSRSLGVVHMLRGGKLLDGPLVAVRAAEPPLGLFGSALSYSR
jgi:hypothetical protein